MCGNTNTIGASVNVERGFLWIRGMGVPRVGGGQGPIPRIHRKPSLVTSHLAHTLRNC